MLEIAGAGEFVAAARRAARTWNAQRQEASMDTIEFHLVLNDRRDWDSAFRSWRCPALKIPGSRISQVRADGHPLRPEYDYVVKESAQFIEWRASSDHPKEIGVEVLLEQELSTAAETKRWRRNTNILRYIVVPILVVLIPAAATIISARSKDSVSSGTSMPTARHKAEGNVTIKGLPYKGQPDWYSDHANGLEQEGDRDKKAGIISAYGVGLATYAAASPTYPLEMVVGVPQGYTIASRSAFRMTSHAGKEVFEVLEPRAVDQTFRELRVSAPECDKGDSVLTLFRVQSKGPGASMNIEDIVKGRIE